MTLSCKMICRAQVTQHLKVGRTITCFKDGHSLILEVCSNIYSTNVACLLFAMLLCMLPDCQTAEHSLTSVADVQPSFWTPQ